MEIVIQAKKLSKDYVRDENRVSALKNVDLEIACGGFLALMGPSGSGKSTLMRLLLGFETPDAGTVTYDGRELSTEKPLLFLVAPALHVHPATDTLLRYFSPEIEWQFVGIDERWREGVRVVFRKRPEAKQYHRGAA